MDFVLSSLIVTECQVALDLTDSSSNTERSSGVYKCACFLKISTSVVPKVMSNNFFVK